MNTTVSAMKKGALGYIPKDSPPEFILSQIEKALDRASLQMQRSRIERSSEELSPLDLVGNSTAMKRLSSQLKLIAESDCPVLLLGESGVGKTTISKAIHEYRRKFLRQSSRPFCGVNLSALSRELIERELFGNEQGAYTGALRRREGYFELADHGTLFLDEIGDISLDIQVKLLKVIEEKKFYRVGGTQEIKSNFKLICATNRNLELLVEKGLFREDLYMRISNFPITVPAIKDRVEDIEDLVRVLLPKVCKETKVLVPFGDIPSDFIEFLKTHPPRGNIRGIEMALEHLLTFAPRNDLGKPFLERWKSIGELKSRFGAKHLDTRTAITLKDIQSLPFNVIDKDFPGLFEFEQIIQDKLFNEARRKFEHNTQIAQALKVVPSTISMRGRTKKKLSSKNASSELIEV